MNPPLESFAGRAVWLSGHTGFKGSWLAEWLLALGARVHGFALDPPTTPSLFDQLGLAGRMEDERGDVRDGAAVRRSVLAARPDFVFHLAAQPIVRASYADPLGTWATNVMGTAHVIDALRALDRPCAAVIVTSDKCYENRETRRGYRETDAMGGSDPYSSSKGAAELAVAAWRRSFFSGSARCVGPGPAAPAAVQGVAEASPAVAATAGRGGPVAQPVRIATARAGNVIGGGDWAADRIVPDCIRRLQRGEPVPVRNPRAVRPWQHVLEPLGGYLVLAARLASASPGESGVFASAFNFGPAHGSNRTVAELVGEVMRHWPGRWEDRSDPAAPHEAGLLTLSSAKARRVLGWRPRWGFRAAVARTVAGYRAALASRDELRRVVAAQIAEWSRRA